MSFFDSLMLFTILVSVFLYAVAFRKIRRYNRVFHFPETKYTKLFGVFRKEHVLLGYGLLLVFHIVFTVFVIFSI